MRHRLPGIALGGLLLITGAAVMAQAEADRRLDAAIERLRGALGPDMRLEIGGRQIDPVTGRAVLTDVVLTDGRGRAAIAEVRLQDVSETRLGRAELFRATIRTPEGGDGAVARVLIAGLPIPVAGKSLDPMNLSFDALEVEAARMDDAARGALRLASLNVREWRPDSVAAAALEGFEFVGAAPDNQVARISRIGLEAVSLPMVNGAFAPLAFRANRISVEGAELRDPGRQVALALRALALQDWQPGRATSLSVQGVQFAAPADPYGAITFTLGRLEATGIDAARTLEAVMTSVQVPDPMPGVPQRLLIETLDGGWNGEPVFALARLLTQGALEGGIASGSMVTEGLRITPPRGQAAWLDALGYREIVGGIELRASAARAGGRMDISPFSIAWQEAAILTMAARFEGMPATPAPGTAVDSDAYAAQLVAAQVANLTFALRDQGLLGRFLASQARQQRIPEARLREQWAQMALALPLPGAPPPGRPGAAPPAKGPGAAAADPIAAIRQALAAFIRQPGTLEIAFQPPKPVAFNEIMTLGAGSPVDAVQRLGLTVVAR